METREPRSDQEHFGEAELGRAQSENPPSDPEMIRSEDDQAAGPPDDPEQIKGG